MDIKNHNWSPAIEMFDEMLNFDKSIKEIQQWSNTIPDFNDNVCSGARYPHLTLEEIKERENKLLLLKAKAESALKTLEAVKEAYHRYQEMYFENLRKP